MTYSSFAKEFSQDGQTLPRLCRCGLQCLLSFLTVMTSNTSTCFFAEVSHRAVSQPPKARLGVQSPTVQDLVFTDTEPQRKSCKAQLNTTCLSRLSREPPTIYTDLILPPPLLWKATQGWSGIQVLSSPSHYYLNHLAVLGGLADSRWGQTHLELMGREKTPQRSLCLPQHFPPRLPANQAGLFHRIASTSGSSFLP